MKNSNIDAILFDFVGVLLFKKKDWQSDPITEAVCDMAGQSINDEKYKKLACERLNITESQFYETVKRTAEKYEMFKKLWDLLSGLRENYKLAVINNGTALTLPKFKSKFPVDERFDLFVSSAIEGIKKPQPEIYLFTAKKLGVKSENCLFMDDSLENINGAKAVGMQTLYWDRTEDREVLLEEFLNIVKPA